MGFSVESQTQAKRQVKSWESGRKPNDINRQTFKKKQMNHGAC